MLTMTNLNRPTGPILSLMVISTSVGVAVFGGFGEYVNGLFVLGPNIELSQKVASAVP